MNEHSPIKDSDATEQQEKLGYKLEDILSDTDLALAIGNLLVQLGLQTLEENGSISRKQHTDLEQVYNRTIKSMLSPEQLESVEEEIAHRELRDEHRRRKGLPPKRTIFD